MVQSENQQQAADQLSISNSIGSLRFLSAMDWREFVERMSTVEQTLREDPAGVYGRMGFTTRDRYRHVVEEIAKKSGLAEDEVARLALLAGRLGGDVALGEVCPALDALLHLTGLAVEVEGQAELAEEPLRAQEGQEEGHPGDLAP